MVECDLAKVEVAGSNPVSRSISFPTLADPRRRDEVFRFRESRTEDYAFAISALDEVLTRPVSDISASSSRSASSAARGSCGIFLAELHFTGRNSTATGVPSRSPGRQVT